MSWNRFVGTWKVKSDSGRCHMAAFECLRFRAYFLIFSTQPLQDVGFMQFDVGSTRTERDLGRLHTAWRGDIFTKCRHCQSKSFLGANTAVRVSAAFQLHKVLTKLFIFEEKGTLTSPLQEQFNISQGLRRCCNYMATMAFDSPLWEYERLPHYRCSRQKNRNCQISTSQFLHDFVAKLVHWNVCDLATPGAASVLSSATPDSLARPDTFQPEFFQRHEQIQEWVPDSMAPGSVYMVSSNCF